MPLLVCGLLLFGLCPNQAQASEDQNPSVSDITQEARKLFDGGHYQKTLEVIGPVLEENPRLSQLRRLKWLSLVLMKKTAEGLDEFERYSKLVGREEDLLLQELMIYSILPSRADMREQVRGAAYSALKEVGSDMVVPYLEEGFSDGTGLIRALVAESLGGFEAGRKSARFKKAVKDPAGLVRAAVIKGLARSEDAQEVLPVIQAALDDEQPLVQVAAAGALFTMGHKEYWARIEQATQASEGYERGAALRMLGDLNDPRALPILEKGLADSQPSIRAAAAASLGKLALPGSADALFPMLNDRIPAVRSVAVVSLGRLKVEKAVPALTRALQDTSFGVRAAAVAALLQMNSPYSLVARTVNELIQHTNPGLRSAAAKALAHGRPRDVVGPLSIVLQDPVPKPRISAARSLGRVGGREVLPLLKRALRDGDEPVRVTAAGAIARILSRSEGI